MVSSLEQSRQSVLVGCPEGWLSFGNCIHFESPSIITQPNQTVVCTISFCITNCLKQIYYPKSPKLTLYSLENRECLLFISFSVLSKLVKWKICLNLLWNLHIQRRGLKYQVEKSGICIIKICKKKIIWYLHKPRFFRIYTPAKFDTLALIHTCKFYYNS